MLDQFLEVAYKSEMCKQAQAEQNFLFSQLPVEDLRKIASGVSLKEACMCGDGESFLDKFKGTPFLPQAVALEQEMLQTEMLEQQKRVEDRERRASEDNVWDARDRIRLKKKLLELELAKSQGGSPDAPAQGAGAPGDVPAEGVQEDSQGLGGMVAKTSSAEKFAFADSVGRQLAHEYEEKVAHVEMLISVGRRAGEMMAKTGAVEFTPEEREKKIKKRRAAEVVAGVPGGIVGGSLGGSVGGLLGSQAGDYFDRVGRRGRRIGDYYRRCGDKWSNRLGVAASLAGLAAGTYGGSKLTRAWHRKRNGSPEEGVDREQARRREHPEKFAMAKTALAVPGLNKALFQGAKSIGGMAVKNPKLLTTGVGAGLGALAGGPDNRMTGALGGAALGYGAGGMLAGPTGKILSTGLRQGAGEVAAARKVVKPLASAAGGVAKVAPAAEGAAAKAVTHAVPELDIPQKVPELNMPAPKPQVSAQSASSGMRVAPAAAQAGSTSSGLRVATGAPTASVAPAAPSIPPPRRRLAAPAAAPSRQVTPAAAAPTPAAAPITPAATPGQLAPSAAPPVGAVGAAGGAVEAMPQFRSRVGNLIARATGQGAPVGSPFGAVTGGQGLDTVSRAPLAMGKWSSARRPAGFVVHANG